MGSLRVCHLTGAHTQEDIRIFHKECVSLAEAGYETYQVSCGETYDKLGVHLIGTGKQASGRMGRIIRSARRVYRAARELDADIYHFHDPELLPYGLKLKKAGKTVIFDSHEDVPAQILDKPWLPRTLRRCLSGVYKAYETQAVRKLDAVVAATPHIAEAFHGRCGRIAVVNNYPRLGDIVFHETPFTQRGPVVCYAGGIDENRGETIMKEAMLGVAGELILAGDHEKEETGNVRYTGRLDRGGVNRLYGEAVAGLCILKPTENYYTSKPIKVYEYMAAGLPYICSDFPGWRKVAEESGAGICVDPENPGEIREKIQLLLEDREKGQAMGRKGRVYVMEHCNWSSEEKSLLTLYTTLQQEPDAREPSPAEEAAGDKTE